MALPFNFATDFNLPPIRGKWVIAQYFKPGSLVVYAVISLPVTISLLIVSGEVLVPMYLY